MTEVRAVALAALVCATAAACAKPDLVDPDEHLVAPGEVSATLASCRGGRYPDFNGVLTRIARAGPMLKANGKTPKQMRAAILAGGGVLVAYRGRIYHSAYMAMHLWRSRDSEVLAYAILDEEPSVVYAESAHFRGTGTYFYPWEEHLGSAPAPRPCR